MFLHSDIEPVACSLGGIRATGATLYVSWVLYLCGAFSRSPIITQ